MTDIIKAGDPVRALVFAIAKDIGKEVAHHIETMYPKAVEATSPSMLRSVEGCVINEILAAISVSDEGQILTRLASRKRFRRKSKRAYREMRSK